MKKDQQKIKTENGNVKNESRGHNEQNIQTAHTQKQVSTKRTGGKINCTNSQAMKGRSLHNITPHVSPETVPGLAFVLYRHVNLNKERNKRARCLKSGRTRI